MATELVDASKLDACCTAEANAIRAKTGSSAQIAYDWANSKGFADAIAAISGGGSGITTETGTVNGNGTHTISFAVAKHQSPDIIIIERSDYTSMTAVTDRANAATIAVKSIMCASTYTAASSTSLANAGCRPDTGADWYNGSSIANNQVGYTQNDYTLYIKAGNNSNLWSTSLTYNYTLIFMS